MNQVITKMNTSWRANDGEMRQVSSALEGVEPERSPEQYIAEYG